MATAVAGRTKHFEEIDRLAKEASQDLKIGNNIKKAFPAFKELREQGWTEDALGDFKDECFDTLIADRNELWTDYLMAVDEGQEYRGINPKAITAIQHYDQAKVRGIFNRLDLGSRQALETLASRVRVLANQ